MTTPRSELVEERIDDTIRVRTLETLIYFLRHIKLRILESET